MSGRTASPAPAGAAWLRRRDPGLWYFATTGWALSPILLPSPISVWHEFVRAAKRLLSGPTSRSRSTSLPCASFIAATCGTVIGYLVSRTRYSVRVFDPLFAGIYSIRDPAVPPLYVLFFGLGPGSKIAIGATIAFFPVVLNTIAGFGYVDRAYVVAARSMGASDAQMFWSVMLPAAFPVVLTGLRMGFILAFLSILGSETIASLAGLGHRIVDLAESMDTARMFAYIFFVINCRGPQRCGVVARGPRQEAPG